MHSIIVLELRHVSLGLVGRRSRHCLGFGLLALRLRSCSSVLDAEQILPFVGDECHSALVGLLLLQVRLELGVLGLQQHVDLFGLLPLQVGLSLGAVGCGVRGFVADLALDNHLVVLVELVEGAGPSPMPFLLAVVAIVVVQQSQGHHIVRIQQFLQLIIFLPFEDVVHLLNSLFQVVVVVCHHNDVQGLVVLEDILLFFVGTSPSHCDFAIAALLNQFLSLSLRPDDLTDVVGLPIIGRTLRQVDLLVLLQGLVVIWGHKCRSHLHAVLNQSDPLALEGVSLADFPGIEPAAVLIVDGLRTDGAQVGVIGREVVDLGGEFVEAIESQVVLINGY